jgi:hypothetical protein
VGISRKQTMPNIIKRKIIATTLTSPSTRSCKAKIAVLNPSVGWSTYIACGNQ